MSRTSDAGPPAEATGPHPEPPAASAALDRLVTALDPLDVDALRAALQDELGTDVTGLMLYGSRARGEEHGGSDWDLLAVTADPRPMGVRRRWNSVDLDVDVRTREALEPAGPDLVYLTPARLLWDPDGFLATLVERLQTRRAAGPEALHAAERERWLAWLHRMLRRIAANLASDPVLAAYQMSWLHMELLNLYFQERRLWTRGPRAALRYLQDHDGDTYAAWCAVADASQPQARHDALRALVARTMPDASACQQATPP